MISVVLTYPNQRQENVLLSAVPRVGDHVRLADAAIDAPSLVIEQVLWLEVTGASSNPHVVLVVRPHMNGPRA